MQILTGHADRVRCVVYSPDGMTLASGGADRTVRLWDLPSATERFTCLGHRWPVLGVAFRLDGRAIVSADWGLALRAWDARTGELLSSFEGPSGVDDPRLADLLRPSSESEDDRRAIETVACYLLRARVRLRHLGRSRWPRSREAEAIRLEIGGQKYLVSFRLTGAGVRPGTFVAGHGATSDVAGCGHTVAAFSPDGRIGAVARDHEIRLNELTTAGKGTLIGRVAAKVSGSQPRRPSAIRTASLLGHSGTIRTLAFSPDGSLLASGGHDGTVRVWDVSNGRELACYDGGAGMVLSVAFSPDGMTLAAGGRNDIVVWDVDVAP